MAVERRERNAKPHVLDRAKAFAARLKRNLASHHSAAHPFDREHGTQTSGYLEGADLVTGHAHDVHATAYYGCSPSITRYVLAQWQQTLPSCGCSLSDYTFLDIGAGMGRALLLASELPFREVVGVELNANLAAIARKNVQHWLTLPRACGSIRVELSDATEFPLPPGPLLVYLFNPFTAPVLEKLIAGIHGAARMSTTPIDIMYVFPDFDAVIEQSPTVETLWCDHVTMSEEDQAADEFSNGTEPCAIYRVHPGYGTGLIP